KKKLALQAAVLIKEEYDTPTFLNPLAPFAISSKVGDIKLTKGMAYLGYSFETATHPK
ncbi:MAG: hypothetical protein HYX94_09110, partial [Chloroflexi bacterium]|nr:hypothetical protein [Chloroflexota bacterium]